MTSFAGTCERLSSGDKNLAPSKLAPSREQRSRSQITGALTDAVLRWRLRPLLAALIRVVNICEPCLSCAAKGGIQRKLSRQRQFRSVKHGFLRRAAIWDAVRTNIRSGASAANPTAYRGQRRALRWDLDHSFRSVRHQTRSRSRVRSLEAFGRRPRSL